MLAKVIFLLVAFALGSIILTTWCGVKYCTVTHPINTTISGTILVCQYMDQGDIEYYIDYRSVRECTVCVCVVCIHSYLVCDGIRQ